MTPAERKAELEEAEREYHPCWCGIHVCGQTPDEERPLTVANIPHVSERVFDELEAKYAIDDDDFDLIVDFNDNGNTVKDFRMRRQSLKPLLSLAQQKTI